MTIEGAYTCFVKAGSSFILTHNTCGKGKASDLPLVKKGSKDWKASVKKLQNAKKTDALNVRVETATDAKGMLNQAYGNMDRFKSYKKKMTQAKKGYEVHNVQNNRELLVGNDLRHLKFKK